MDPFLIPEDITALTPEELTAALEAGQARLTDLTKIADDVLTDDELVEMESINAFLDNGAGEVQAREAVAAERVSKIQAIRDAAAARTAAPAEAEAAAADESAAAEAAAAEEAANAESVKIAAAVKPAPKPAVVSAAARIARVAPANVAVSAPEITLTAAADVPGFASGHRFDTLDAASQAVSTRLKSLPTGGTYDGRIRLGALNFSLPKTALTLSQNDFMNADSEMLMQASAESRLEGQNVVAAGGWGPPSNIMLEFCEMETTEGLFDLPEVTITRGGVQYTKGPDFSTILASSTGFWDMTETTAIAGVEQKTSLRPTIPPFIEKRLDAVGTMVEAGLLLRSGWPELVARTVRMAIVAHEHRMAAKKLALVRAFTGAGTTIGNLYTNALDALHAVELVILGERQRYALSPRQTMEVLAPEWAKAVIRADLANRTGVDMLAVSDQQIDAFFAVRGAKVQWLMGYQPLTLVANTPATVYPQTLDLIVYPAGTFVAGVADVITLETIYDSVNLKKNDYVALFMEQGLLVTNPCHDARRFNIAFTANGRTGSANIVKNLTAV